MSGLGQKSLSGGDQGQGRQGEEQWLQIGRLSLIVLTCKLEKLSGWGGWDTHTHLRWFQIWSPGGTSWHSHILPDNPRGLFSVWRLGCPSSCVVFVPYWCLLSIVLGVDETFAGSFQNCKKSPQYTSRLACLIDTLSLYPNVFLLSKGLWGPLQLKIPPLLLPPLLPILLWTPINAI